MRITKIIKKRTLESFRVIILFPLIFPNVSQAPLIKKKENPIVKCCLFQLDRESKIDNVLEWIALCDIIKTLIVLLTGRSKFKTQLPNNVYTQYKKIRPNKRGQKGLRKARRSAAPLLTLLPRDDRPSLDSLIYIRRITLAHNHPLSVDDEYLLYTLYLLHTHTTSISNDPQQPPSAENPHRVVRVRVMCCNTHIPPSKTMSQERIWCFCRI